MERGRPSASKEYAEVCEASAEEVRKPWGYGEGG
jgi:hypothetical protein